LVPVAKVQLLIGTSVVLRSFVMASSVVHLAHREDEHVSHVDSSGDSPTSVTALHGD
jgi:hypothetical protein